MMPVRLVLLSAAALVAAAAVWLAVQAAAHPDAATVEGIRPIDLHSPPAGMPLPAPAPEPEPTIPALGPAAPPAGPAAPPDDEPDDDEPDDDGPDDD